MRLTTVGVSGSLPGPGSPASCHLVEVPDPRQAGRVWRLVLDLGNGSLGALQRHVDPRDLDAVLLSHLHPDHCLDVCPLYVLLRYDPRGPGPRIPVWGPAGVCERLARSYDPGAVRDPGTDGPFTDLLDFHEFRARVPVTVGPVTVTPVPVHHPVEAYGFRVTAPVPGGGRPLVLAYSGDTGPGPGLDELAAGADLLLCEAGFTIAQSSTPGLHCSGRDAGEAARRGGAGHLVLTHVPPWNAPATALAEAAEVFAGPLDLGRPGASWEVKGRRPAPVALVDRLDPDHRSVVEARPPVDVSDVARSRAERAATVAATPVPPDPRVRRSDSDANGVPVRLYRPAPGPAAAPALLWLHGGGFVMGGLDEDDALCDDLVAGTGCVVVSVGYRLAPEHPCPAPLEDAYTALAWLTAEAPRLGVDGSRVAVGGFSAGGGLAAGLAILARDRGAAPLALQLLMAPMLDDRDRARSVPVDRRLWHPEANARAWQAYLGDAAGGPGVPVTAAPGRASAADLAGLPPAYLAVGDLDLFLDECLDHTASLTAAGVPVELHVYPGAVHGSTGWLPRAELSRRWRADRDAALRRAFRLAGPIGRHGRGDAGL
ncbi:MAG: alpha/beta hydrolase fold domain-containing protein [Kineosporiaceae bacterium]